MSQQSAVIFRNPNGLFDVRFGTAWLPNQVEVVGFAIKMTFSDGGLPHKLTLHPQLQLEMDKPIFNSEFHLELDGRKKSLKAAIKKAIDGLYDLNNGFIAHRIEDRLGFDRGSISIYGDEDGNLTAVHWPTDSTVQVQSEDKQPY